MITSGAAKVYIAWKRECFRGLQSAHVFGLDLELIHPYPGRGRVRTLVRYMLSGAATIRLLSKRKPSTVAILNQPLPLVLVAWAYCRLTRARLILDGHSKVYEPTAPRWLQAIYRRVSRAPSLTLNHNSNDAARLEQWGCPHLLVESLPFTLPVQSLQPIREKVPYVLVVCSFASDEPVDVILGAAKLLPDVAIRITGDFTKAGLVPAQFPPNVEPTGYLATQQYYDIFAGAAAIVTLSRRSWIMQMAIEEALLLGVPPVTNRSPVLESVLEDAGVFVDLDPADLARGLRDVLTHNETYRAKIRNAGERQRSRIKRLLAEAESQDLQLIQD